MPPPVVVSIFLGVSRAAVPPRVDFYGIGLLTQRWIPHFEHSAAGSLDSYFPAHRLTGPLSLQNFIYNKHLLGIILSGTKRANTCRLFQQTVVTGDSMPPPPPSVPAARIAFKNFPITRRLISTSAHSALFIALFILTLLQYLKLCSP